MATRFTDLVGCHLPIQLAAMGGVGTTELAAAVIGAGGFGMVNRRTEPAPGGCGKNFLVPFDPDMEEVLEAAARARVVEFFYGDPDAKLVDAAHSGGALAAWQVGSAAEAAAAIETGCDFVVAQGIEAGGHVRGTMPLDELLPRVLAAVRVPVVAAGGIATAERVAELLRQGADGVRVGTRFIATPESAAHPQYIAKLLEATDLDTMMTEWFGEGWEHAPTGCCALPKLPPGRAVGVRPHRRPGTSTVRSRTWRCTRAPALGTFDRCSLPRRLSPTSSGCCPDARVGGHHTLTGAGRPSTNR